MQKTYPRMASCARVYNSPVENVIKGLKDNYYDLVFTVAVLYHIHTDSEWIFPEMVRITKHS